MYQSVTLIGHIGRDPELRETKGGTPVCNFTMATKSGWGEREYTEWHRIVVFGQSAEFTGKYLSKGDLVTVVGRIQSRKWVDKDGEERISYEIVSTEVKQLRGSGRRQDSDESSVNGPGNVPNDDIPF